MNIIFKSFLIVFLLFISSSADEKSFIEKTIPLITKPIYNMDFVELPSIIKPLLSEYKNIKAISIVESIQNKNAMTFYQDNGQLIFNKTIPEKYLQLKKRTQKIYYIDEDLATISIYYEQTIKRDIHLNSLEKAFIIEHPILRVSSESDYSPFDFSEDFTKDGKPVGYSIDIINLIARNIGIDIEYIPDTWMNLLTKVKNKEIDLIHTLKKTKQRQEFLLFSDSYMKTYEAIFTQKNTNDIKEYKDFKNKRIGIVKGETVITVINKDPNKNFEIVLYDDYVKLLKSLSVGEVDAVIIDVNVGQYIMKKQSLYNLKSTGDVFEIDGIQKDKEFHVGIRDDYPLLKSIINKGLQSISDAEFNELNKKWFNTDKKEEKQFSIGLTAEEKKWIKNNTLKVGVEDWAPVIYLNSAKDIDGITGDVLKLISKKTGLKIEIINDLWDPLLSGLKNKEIDLLPATYYTDERATYGLYTDGYYKMLDYIYVKDNNDDIDSMQDLKGKKIAIQKGFGTIPKIREKFPSIQIIETKNLLDSINQVLTGKVDALYEGQIAVEYKIQDELINGLKGIPQSEFNAAELHLFVRDDKPILRTILQKTLDSISYEQMKQIKSKWVNNQKGLKLSNKEQLWLDKNQIVKYVYDPDWAPFEWKNELNNHVGVIPDILKLVSEKSGIKLEQTAVSSWKEAIQKAKNREVDMYSAVNKTDARAKYMNYTQKSVYQTSYVFVVNKEDKSDYFETFKSAKNKKVAVVEGYSIQDKLKKDMPDFPLLSVPSVKEGLSRLQHKELDVFIVNSATAQYYINKLGFDTLKIATTIDYKLDLKIAIRNDWPMEIVSIIDKALGEITQKELNNILDTWFNKDNNIEPSITQEVQREELSFIGLLTFEEVGFAFFILLILLILVYTQFTKAKFLNIKLGKFNMLIVLFEMAVIFFLVYEIVVLDRTENLLANTHSNQSKMIQATDKLRQSSDDLTHFVRSYSVTNDTKFKQQYFDTLDIRNGVKPRPLFYDSIYWDLSKKYRESTHPAGKKESLKSIIEKLSFSNSQKELLQLSEKNSNDLVSLEVKAFEAMEKKNQSLAIKLLHSKEYYKAKEKIMVPIDKLIISIRLETQKEIDFLHEKIKNQFVFILIVGLFFIVGNFIIYLMLIKKVNKPIDYLSKVIDKFKSGRKDIEKRVFYNDEIGETIEQFFIMREVIEERTIELKEFQQRLEMMIDGSGDGLWEYDYTENKLWWSPRFLEMMGYKENEMEVNIDTHLSHIHLDDLEKQTNAYQEHLKTDCIYDHTYRTIKKDGTYFWSRVRGKTLRDENGRALKTSGSVVDVTELQNQKKQTESILTSIMLPMLITSKERRDIVYANTFAENQYETTQEEILGLSIDILYTYENQKDDILEEMITKGKIKNFETKFKTLKDNEFDALLSLVAIQYNGEECYLGVASDISEQKNRELLVKALHKNTSDSIEYASLIQHALIPEQNLFDKYFKDYFTIWQPKDVVGGDIYLFEELRDEDECLLMVIDCTGHGVPGAFVTMLVKAIERQIVSKIENDKSIEVSPAWILSYFNKTMKKLLQQESEDSISNAGFDGGVLYYNKKENYVKYAGSETPLFYIQNDELKMFKSDRHSIGYKKSDVHYEFNEHKIDIDTETKIYISTDGYLDQNGGNKGFPFGKKRFQALITEHNDFAFNDQKEVLMDCMQDYMGNEERNDDTTVIGLKLVPNI